MCWDLDDLRRYERWLASSAGEYALALEFDLLSHLTSHWPRRGRRLLDIGCGPGVFLEHFHRAGFDVTGLDRSPLMVEAARERIGPLADVQVCEATHLPFEDNSFDYASLLTVLEFIENPLDVLREASRVAKRGILVGYLNRMSLYRLCAGSGTLLSRARWFWPWRMRSLVRTALAGAHLRERSVLPGPPATWRTGFPLFQAGRLVLPPWLGGYCALAVDLIDEPPLTPLPAWRTRVQPTKSF